MKNKKIPIILSSIIGLVLLVAILEKTHVINLYQSTPDVTQGPSEEQKKQETEANADSKKQFIESQDKQDNPKPPSSPLNKSIELTTQHESNNTLTVFTKLPGYSSGTCELKVTNGSAVKTQSAPVIYQPEFSSCAGFSVPVDSLGKGIWTIQLAVTSNDTTDSKSITYEVK